MEVAVRDRERQGSFDLEALEMATREVMHRCGAIILEHLLDGEDGASLERSCPCGGRFLDKKHQEKTVRTVLGPVRLRRTRQCCDSCGTWRVPEDIVLDVIRTGFSPGIRRMMAKCGATVCFDKAREFIDHLAGIRVTAKDVERIAEATGQDIARREKEKIKALMDGQDVESNETPSILYIATDGTGVPVLRRETQGRKGKAEDGIARTREVKLAAIFTQTYTDKEGKPIRDKGSTTYVGKVESVETFGPRLYHEACRRGANKAQQLVVLGDGAPWIWNLADEQFPGAIQIVDFYHAKEHLGDVARILFPDDQGSREAWLKTISDNLWEGMMTSVLDELHALRVRGKKKDLVNKTMEYFEKNKDRMRYGYFRREGLFIGSGIVEAGCKSLIGGRLKQSGMHWTVRGANDIIALKCCIESGTFEDYWELRNAA